MNIWKLKFDLQNQVTDTVEVIVDEGTFSVVEATRTAEKSTLRVRARTVSELASYVNEEGLPGMKPGTVQATVLVDGQFKGTDNKIIFERPVPDVEIEDEVNYRTATLRGKSLAGSWELVVTDREPIDQTKEYPVESIRVEAAYRRSNFPDNDNQSQLVTSLTLGDSVHNVTVTVPASELVKPASPGEDYSYAGVRVLLEAELNVDFTNPATPRKYFVDEKYSETVKNTVEVGASDIVAVSTGTQNIHEEGVGFLKSGFFKYTVSHVHVRCAEGKSFERLTSKNNNGAVIFRYLTEPSLGPVGLAQKINEEGIFYAIVTNSPQGEAAYFDNFKSYDATFNLIAEDERQEGIHYGAGTEKVARSTPANPLPQSQFPNNIPPVEQGNLPGNFYLPSSKFPPPAWTPSF